MYTAHTFQSWVRVVEAPCNCRRQSCCKAILTLRCSGANSMDQTRRARNRTDVQRTSRSSVHLDWLSRTNKLPVRELETSGTGNVVVVKDPRRSSTHLIA